MARKMSIGVSFIAPTGSRTLGPKSFEKAVRELIESNGGKVGNFNVYYGQKVVDREPLVKVGQRVWVDLNDRRIVDSEIAEGKLGVVTGIVKEVEPLPGSKGWFIGVSFSKRLILKLGWMEDDVLWVWDGEAFTSKPV